MAENHSLEKALAGCRDANGWTEERATAWWSIVGSKETAEHQTFSLPAQK